MKFVENSSKKKIKTKSAIVYMYIENFRTKFVSKNDYQRSFSRVGVRFHRTANFANFSNLCI